MAGPNTPSPNDDGANVFLVLLWLAPGMLTLLLIDWVFNLQLGKGQMWIFSVVAQLVILFAVVSIAEGQCTTAPDAHFAGREALDALAGVSFLIILTFLVAGLGFKAEWPSHLLSRFF
jgi:hypothetical protein